MEAFEPSDRHNIVFETPVGGFQRDNVVDLLQELGDCRNACLLIFWHIPEDLDFWQVIPLDAKTQPHGDGTAQVVSKVHVGTSKLKRKVKLYSTTLAVPPKRKFPLGRSRARHPTNHGIYGSTVFPKPAANALGQLFENH